MNVMRILSALLLKRLLKPVLVIVAIVGAALYVITALLALSFSSWWWLLLLILIPVTIFLLLLALVLRFLLNKLIPQKLSKSERNKVSGFIDTLFSLAERSKTPYPVLLFLIAKDVVRGKESSFLRDLIGDSKKVTGEFEEIRTLLR